MKIKIDNLNINYIQYGEGSDILLLHGWGQNIEMMKFLGDNFADNHRITILDFPGFGESDEPLSPWTIKDYSLLIEKLVKELDIKKPVVMGHSFGGRVAIYYSSNNPIEKLVLFGSPCIRKDKELPLSVKILKGIKKLPGMDKLGEYMKQYIGSRDYKAASPIMRQTLVNVVNEDLTPYAMQIEEPTLLICSNSLASLTGASVSSCPQISNDAALIVLPGTHYAYLENLNQVVNILNSFI